VTGTPDAAPSPPDPQPPPPPASEDAGGPAAADAGAPAVDPPAVPTPDPPAPDAGAPDLPPPVASPCEALTPGPLPFSYRRNVPASDDFTFDGAGYLLAFEGDSVVRLASNTRAELLIPNVTGRGGGGGLLALPGGDVVVADHERSLLVRLDADNRRRLIERILSPRKMARGPGGKLYVTGAQRIFRVDPETLATAELVEMDFNPNGITFSLDRRTLYVSDRSDSSLYSLKVSPEGTVGPPQRWVGPLGAAARPDGLTTDECGNVYVVGLGDGVVRRISPAGRLDTIVDLGDPAVSSLSFGSGKHGWDDRSLYGVDSVQGGVFEIKVGVRGAPAQ
jgi:hypothetical protein